MTSLGSHFPIFLPWLNFDDDLVSLATSTLKGVGLRMGLWKFLSLSRTTSLSDRNDSSVHQMHKQESSTKLPVTQRALVLYALRQPYKHTGDHPLPRIESEREILVKTEVIGLNPIDWKAPDYGFGIPQLPYVSGRECVGRILTPPRRRSRFKEGDRILVVSTDYRDLRKAAFQEHVIVTDFNVARLPANISSESGAGVGVAFVAAALMLGVCAGVNFSDVLNGPDLLDITRKVDPQRLPEDIRAECMSGIELTARARNGDYLAIWGGSSMTAYMTTQLARLAGLKVISILDSKKHAFKKYGDPDLIVDSHDPQRAIAIVRSATSNSLHFGIDTVGRTTAETLLKCLHGAEKHKITLEQQQTPTPPPTPHSDADSIPLSKQHEESCHLIGLTGLPKVVPPQSTRFHSVPIKLFHEVPEIGGALMQWLEHLLEQGLIRPPDVVATDSGLENVNLALDRMRRGDISGGRSVIRVE
jgi:NADPH:quinone reductase-like Zn-dependent oxidoreductase